MKYEDHVSHKLPKIKSPYIHLQPGKVSVGHDGVYIILVA